MQYREKCTNRHLCMRSMINPYNETLKHFRHSKEREKSKERTKTYQIPMQLVHCPSQLYWHFNLKTETCSAHMQTLPLCIESLSTEHRAPSIEYTANDIRCVKCELRGGKSHEHFFHFLFFSTFNLNQRTQHIRHSAHIVCLLSMHQLKNSSIYFFFYTFKMA